MLFVFALAAAILIHEALYICRDGRQYLTLSFLPTFGLKLWPGAYAALHLCLMAACLALLWMPENLWLQRTCFVLLSLVIASYTLRVSNHLILAWFMLLVVCAAPFFETRHAGGEMAASFVGAGVRTLVILTYAFAFFHKLNSEYFSIEHSFASQLARFYCWDRGIEHPKLVRCISQVAIYGTVFVEGLLPVLLLFPATVYFGVLLAFLFHFVLALLGIVNFSAVMYAGLLAFIPASMISAAADRVASAGLPAIAGVCTLFMVVVWVLTPRRANRHCPYRMRNAAWAIQLTFGVVTALLLMGSVALLSLPEGERVGSGSLPAAGRWFLLGVWGVFLLNGLAPYLGIKTEFSFAMFSNLRSDPWRHLIVPAKWRVWNRPSYVHVERIRGLPDPAHVSGDPAAALALHLLSQSGSYRYSSYFFREALQRLCSVASPSPTISIRYVERGRRHDVDFDRFSCPAGGKILPFNLFPFVLPLDPDAPHSEQGTILTGGTGRQLF